MLGRDRYIYTIPFQPIPGASIRVVTIDNKPWFVAADVCKALCLHLNQDGSANTTNSLRKLDPDQVTLYRMKGQRGLPMKLIAESGLYKLAMRSNKPEAKGFQDWVTKVVLPAIRKDGGYILGEEKVVTGEMSEDDLLAKALVVAMKKVERLSAG